MDQSSLWVSLWNLWKYVLGGLGILIIMGVFIQVFNIGVIFSLTIVLVVMVTVFLFRKANSEQTEA